MKTLAVILLTLAFTATASVQAPGSDPTDALLEMLGQADAVSIEYYSKAGKDEVTFTDPGWVQRLSAALAFASYKPDQLCLCMSYPTIRLLRDKKVIGTLSIHHAQKLRAFTDKLSGDYLVRTNTAEAIVALANEKKTR